MPKQPGGRPTKDDQQQCKAMIAYRSGLKHPPFGKQEVLKSPGTTARAELLGAADLPTLEGVTQSMDVLKDTSLIHIEPTLP